MNDRATISPVKSRSHELPESVKKQLKFEAEPGHQISSDRNRELHPLVRKTRTVLNGKSASLDQEAQLSICVNKPSQERAFALLSSLLYAFDARGFKVELRVGNDRGSLVIINEESLHFSLEEESKRVEVQGAKFSFGKTYEKKWTGKLTFRSHDWFAQRRQMAWSDSVRQPLEDQFNRMIPALVELSLVIREKRLAQEAKMAAFHEQIRQRDLDIRRRRQLESDSKNSQIAVELRSLIACVVEATPPEERDSAQLARWLKWSNQVAAGSDPLSAGLKSFLDRYEF